MKKFFIAVVLLLMLLVSGVALLPVLVPMEVVAEKVKAQIKAETGRDVEFSGVKFSFWPNLGIDLQDVTFSNAGWAKEKNMFSLSKMEAALALKPLIERRLEIKKFTFIEPVISLEINAKGQPNWLFGDKSKTKDKADIAGEGVSDKATPSDITKGFDFKFSEFKIKNGKLNFINHQTGLSEKLSNIDVVISMPDLKSALNLKGGVVFRDKQLDLDVFIKEPLSLAKGRVSPGSLKLKTEDVAFKANGNFAIQGEMLNGDVDAKIISLPKLLTWLTKENIEGLPFEKVSFVSSLRASKTDLILKDSALQLDEVRANGNVNVGFSGKPDIFARLSLDKLNLDRFIDSSTSGSSSENSKSDKKSPEGWDNSTIDLSSLGKVNADLKLKTKGFSLQGVNVGASDLTVVLNNSVLQFKSSEAELFGGKFSSHLKVNAASKKPAMEFSFDVGNVQAKPILTTFANFSKLSGAASGKISVQSSGKSQKEIISNLGGNGDIVFKNGSFEGIDLVKIAQLVQNRMSNMGVGQGKTDFVSLGGDFTIKNGIVSNNNFKMKGPLLQASGKGVVDLPSKYINYRVTPVLTASSDVENAGGLEVPVDIKGGFNNIKVKPDFAAVIQNIVTNPEDAQKTIQDVQTNVKEQIKEIKKDPAKAIQSIFGGGGLFGGAFPAPSK